jgi:hypothetical protein
MDLYLWAAQRILAKHRRPMRVREILELAYEDGFFADNIQGATPHKTMHARLSTNIVENGEQSNFIRTGKVRSFSSVHPLAHLRCHPLQLLDRVKDALPTGRRRRSRGSKIGVTSCSRELSPIDPSRWTRVAFVNDIITVHDLRDLYGCADLGITARHLIENFFMTLWPVVHDIANFELALSHRYISIIGLVAQERLAATAWYCGVSSTCSVHSLPNFRLHPLQLLDRRAGCASTPQHRRGHLR